MPPCNEKNDNEQEIEYASVKFLLKQVYSAHITKIRGLQDEVNSLREELESTKKQLNDSKSNCTQCKELQDAFTACKTALLKQTRWFENLGQKISDSKEKSTGSKDDGDKYSNFSVFSKPEQFTKDYNSNAKVSSNAQKVKLEEISQLFSPSEVQSLDLKSEPGIVISLPNKPKTAVNLLNISMQQSHMLGIVPERSSLPSDAEMINSDSYVLVSDSEDISGERYIKQEVLDISSPIQVVLDNSKAKKKDMDVSSASVLQPKVARKKFKATNQCEVKKNDPSECIEALSKVKPDNSKKRTLSDCSDGKQKTKKHNNLNTVTSSNLTAKIDKVENDSVEIYDKLVHEDNGEIEVLVTKKLSPKSKSVEKHCSQSKTAKKSCQLKALDIRIVNVSENVSMKEQQKCKEDLLVCVNEDSSKDSSSTSVKHIVPCVKTKVNKKDISPEEIPSDNDDFQSAFSSTSSSVISKSCDKKQQKKLTKLKLRSKYKMTLDAPSLNYKKPNYKQTKLSKNIFKPKVPQETLQQVEGGANLETKSPVHKTFANIKGTLSMDFDATFIPENFRFTSTQNSNVLGDIGNMSQHSGTTNKFPSEELHSEKSFKESISQDLLADAYVSREKGPGILHLNDDEEDEDDITFQDEKEKSKENTASFDRLPMPEEPNYKYKEETVRNRVQRKQMNAFECKDCENYFSELGLTDNEKHDRLKQCSRHRAKFVPPSTPDHFWEIEFPDTQECKVRGYQGETQMVQLKTRRRRPLM